MKQYKRSVSIICIFALLISCLSLGATALSGNMSKANTDKEAPAHDISVMTFNILERESTGVYALPNRRGPMVVKTILEVMPDIIGIQEAADASSSNDNFDWNDYLINALTPFGYDCRYLTQETAHPGKMTIGAGLMIFYKRDRFDLQDHGSAQYVSDGQQGTYAAYEGFSRVDNSRYYHWVKLYDKTKGFSLYTFNTHLSVPAGSLKQNGKEATSAQRTMLANITRTKQAAQLAQAIEKTAGDCPFFATGDYNSSWNTSKADDPNAYQLLKMLDSGTIAAAGDHAHYQISYFYNSLIDHVFYNSKYNSPLVYRGIYETFGGYQPSDHKAMMAYFNYLSPITFGTGKYNALDRTFTDTVAADSYTLSVASLPKNVTCTVSDGSGNKLDGALSLPARKNLFTFHFLINGAPLFDITATIYNTTSILPSVTANAGTLHFYKDAYYLSLSKETNAVTLETDGTLYIDAACTISAEKTLRNFPIGQSEYFILHNGIKTPLYIRKADRIAADKTLYVDEKLTDAKGTVSFYSDAQTVSVEMGKNGFATLSAAATVANTADGYTVYVAPGTYKENVTFSKDVTLLGNNDGIAPFVRHDAQWERKSRLPETIIDGRIQLSKSTNSVFAVRGFRFYGRADVDYAIYQSASNQKYTTEFDIGYNYFDFLGNNTTNSSCIQSNTSTRAMGNIHDNFFDGSSDNYSYMTRAFTVRNPKGLILENNYFINFSDALCFVSSEIGNQNLSPGYCDITFRYNRFSNCANIYINNPTVTKDTYADVQFLYNDFIECANRSSDYALKLYLSANNEPVSDLSKVSVTIFGNRFFECYRAIYLRRNSVESDLRLAKLNITQNRFYGHHQHKGNDALHLYFDLPSAQEAEMTSTLWDFSHNYFTSDVVEDNHPDHFVKTDVTVNDKTVDCIDRDLLLPYYLDADMTKLSNKYTLPVQTGITVSETEFNVDGKPHGIKVNVPDDAVISYSTDTNEATRIWQSGNPTRTLPGETVVYFMVERAGYQNYYGSATLRVLAEQRQFTYKNKTVYYDGTYHALPFEAQEGDSVYYTYQGKNYAVCPAFKEIGAYDVTAHVSNPLYGSISMSARLTVTSGRLTDIALTGVSVLYDGQPHSPTVVRMLGTETVTFSVNGGPYSDELPAFTEIGVYDVMAKFVAPNYTTAYRSAIIEILPKENRCYTLESYCGPADNEMHGVTIGGLTDKDRAVYSVDGITYNSTAPAYALAGNYPVFVKISRQGYEDIILQTEIKIGVELALCSIRTVVKTDLGDNRSVSYELSVCNDSLWCGGDVLIYEYGIYGSQDTVLEQKETGIQLLPARVDQDAFAAGGGLYLCYRAEGKEYKIFSPILK